MALAVSSSSSSSSSATVAVEKATSDLLMGPDWTMNIEICDSINSNHWQPKDVVRAVKKRLQHKSSKVQLLALTLLETMVKNCGDFVRYQIAERNILDEMIKIVRKKTDMQVRNKILVLLDSWQEAFGGADGKYPQYYWAYEELRRSGVVFPKRSSDAAPIFTPPLTHPSLRHFQAGYGMPSTSSKRLDETMATEIENLSLSSLESMRHVMELLSDMLQAVNPSDRAAVKDEVIIDLVDRCRTNQKKLMQMLTTTGDEELLGQGLELNDTIQNLLARHDAIASGTLLPAQDASPSTQSTEVRSSSPNVGPTTKESPSAPVFSVRKSSIDEEEEEDEFAQLARRHSKAQPMPSKDAPTGSNEGSLATNTNSTTASFVPEHSTSVPCNALALPDPPATVNTGKDQDIIDLLSLTLSAASSSPQAPGTPSTSSQEMHQASVQSSVEEPLYAPQTYPGNLYNSYVVPWAQPKSDSQQQIYQQPQQLHPHSQAQNLHPRQQAQQLHPHQQAQPLHPHPPSHNQLPSQPQHVFQHQPPSQLQNQHLHYPARQQPQLHHEPQQVQPYHQHQVQSQPQSQPQLQSQPQPQSQLQNQHLQYPSRYPPPPWAPTPGYLNNQNHLSNTNMPLMPQANTTASYTPAQGAGPLQHQYSFPSTGNSGSAISGDPRGNPGPRNPASATGQKPFVPSYRLFEDLDVFGNTDGRKKMTNSGTSSSLSGAMGPGMVGGRK